MCDAHDTTTIVEKGCQGEDSLNLWFLENSVSFLPIKQTSESFAQVFKDRIKRPDFLVLFESFGIVAVDAKNCAPYYNQFSLAKDELDRAIAFELITRIAFWFAFLSRENGDFVWYWINALRALEVGQLKTNNQNNQEFLLIGLRNFVPIRTETDLGRLISKRLLAAPNIRLSSNLTGT